MNLTSKGNISSILEALAYFDVFDFPLSYEEVYNYSKVKSKELFDNELKQLLKDSVIYEVNNFYSLTPNKSNTEKRKKGEGRAKSYTSQALKKSKLIAKFPYVRGVFISGSLSKGVMAEDGDIDYFIITKPNRLWIARTLLILYKKIILLNSRKYFCVNYFIDEEHLEIEQKNRFTATEIVTLLPMVNQKLYDQFLIRNDWTKDYYINANKPSAHTIELKRSLFQNFTEPILNTPIGDRLDAYFMRITLKKWYSKFGTMNESDFNIAMKSTKRVSKHHPSNFQSKVLEGYQQRIDKLNN